MDNVLQERITFCAVVGTGKHTESPYRIVATYLTAYE